MKWTKFSNSITDAAEEGSFITRLKLDSTEELFYSKLSPMPNLWLSAVQSLASTSAHKVSLAYLERLCLNEAASIAFESILTFIVESSSSLRQMVFVC